MRSVLPLALLLAACRPAPAVTPTSTPTPVSSTPTVEAPELVPSPQFFSGTIELPGAALPFYVTLAPHDVSWTATIDIPLQGTRGLALQNVIFDGQALSFSLDLVAAKWTITLDTEGDSTACELLQAGATFPCSVTAIDAAAFAELTSPKRPQTPKPPFPYTTREVTLESGAELSSRPSGPVKLAGTLAIPSGPGPHPAAILITGSGAQDRDETLFDHKPFAVLADHLARNGVATLRLDDRGVGGSTGDLSQATTDILAADVLVAHAWLRTQPEIAADKVGVIGHSEGGIVGPAAAAKDRSVAFVVMLAGTGVPGEQIVVKQTELITRKSGMADADVKQAIAQQRQIFETLAKVKDEAAARARIAEIIRTTGPVDDAALLPQVDMLFSPWFRAFMAHDPRPVLAKVKVPVLALVGELDLQVDADQNLPEIEKALKKAKNRRVTARRLPGLNHLFQPAQTGLVAEYGAIEQTMSPEVLALVSGWIVALWAEPTPRAAKATKQP